MRPKIWIVMAALAAGCEGGDRLTGEPPPKEAPPEEGGEELAPDEGGEEPRPPGANEDELGHPRELLAGCTATYDHTVSFPQDDEPSYYSYTERYDEHGYVAYSDESHDIRTTETRVDELGRRVWSKTVVQSEFPENNSVDEVTYTWDGDSWRELGHTSDFRYTDDPDWTYMGPDVWSQTWSDTEVVGRWDSSDPGSRTVYTLGEGVRFAGWSSWVSGELWNEKTLVWEADRVVRSTEDPGDLTTDYTYDGEGRLSTIESRYAAFRFASSGIVTWACP